MSSSRASEPILRRIRIYPPENPDSLNVASIRDSLASRFPTVEVVLQSCLWTPSMLGSVDDSARMLAESRVKDVKKARQDNVPMYGELDYERRSILGKGRIGGIVYDGRMLVEALLRSTLERPTIDVASIVITDRLVSTFSHDDLRHHLRTIVFGFPSIISVAGVVEAPARPKEYYFLRQRLEAEGAGPLALEELKKSFSGRIVDHGDHDKIIEVLNGLALQAVLFHLTLDPFCLDRNCRFFNAHWQEDLIRSQVESKSFCEKHDRMMRELGTAPVIRW